MKKIIPALILLSILIMPPGLAIAAESAATNTVAQSYDADPSVLTGMAVQLKPSGQTTVIPVEAKDIHKTIGVVAPIDGANIVLSPPTATSQQVLVAPTGRYSLLVSNQNGAIRAGDYLTVSALAGISMKANSGQSEIIGRAVSDFNGKSNTVDTVNIKNNGGGTVSVAVGYVQADVRLAPNPLYHNDNNLPGFLSKAARSVANKPVSALRVYLSVTVLVATLFITGSMLYGGVRGGMTAIGRNPLAKGIISRGLLQTIIFGLVVLMLGMLAAYGVLL
jgi:hypothetical protein